MLLLSLCHAFFVLLSFLRPLSHTGPHRRGINLTRVTWHLAPPMVNLCNSWGDMPGGVMCVLSLVLCEAQGNGTVTTAPMPLLWAGDTTLPPPHLRVPNPLWLEQPKAPLRDSISLS